MAIGVSTNACDVGNLGCITNKHGGENCMKKNDYELRQGDLLPGWTTHRWGGVIAGLLGSCCVLLFISALVFLGTQTEARPFHPAFVVFATTAVTTGVVGGLMTPFAAQKERRELAAGYTTSAQGHHEVERRDWKYGVIMREANTGKMSYDDWVAAKRRIQAYVDSQKVAVDDAD
jgi:hypothetical protein